MEIPRHFNRHHLFYSRREYIGSSLYQSLRSQPGLIIPMDIGDHEDLHEALRRPVPKPDRDAVKFFLGHVLTHSPDDARDHGLVQAIAWFTESDNLPTAEHLYAQRQFILRTPLLGEAA